MGKRMVRNLSENPKGTRRKTRRKLIKRIRIRVQTRKPKIRKTTTN